MGNSHGGFSLLRNAGDSSYHFQRGKSVTINMKDGEYKREVDGKVTQTWEVSYDVEGLTCTLSMVKTLGADSNEKLEINIKDSTHREKISHEVIKEYSEGFCESVQTSETGLLDVSYVCSSGYSRKARGRVIEASSSTYFPQTRKTTNSTGVTTSTTICRTGSGTRQGLLVREWKKKKGDEKPYMGTIAYYYANSNSRESNPRSRLDIGLSIVVKIRVSDNGYFTYLDFTIDGPVQHPSSALFYMFEEVERTRVWEAMACPHCANIQRQRRWMLWQSESEDSDSLPPARAGYYGRGQQNARNNGVFVGDANGSIFENNIMFFSGRS